MNPDQTPESPRPFPSDRREAALPILAAEPTLAQDWLSPEEEAAWVNL